MDCRRWTEALIDHLAGELPEEEAVLLEQHLAECETCRREERSLSGILASPPEAVGSPQADGCRPATETMPAGQATDPAGAEPAWMRRVLASGAAASARGPGSGGFPLVLSWFRRPLPAYAVVLLLLLAAGVGLWLGRAHSIGHARQTMNLLGYALMVNGLALHRHQRRRTQLAA